MLFYQQTDGIAMGRPASSTTAEIYMQAYEQTAISVAPHPPKILERFVDDFYSMLWRTAWKMYALAKLFPSHQQSSCRYKFTIEE